MVFATRRLIDPGNSADDVRQHDGYVAANIIEDSYDASSVFEFHQRCLLFEKNIDLNRGVSGRISGSGSLHPLKGIGLESLTSINRPLDRPLDRSRQQLR
jgi:hypothetical protein